MQANVALGLEAAAFVILFIPTAGSDSLALDGSVGVTVAWRVSIQQRLTSLVQVVTTRIARGSSAIGEYDEETGPARTRWQRGMDIYTKVGDADPAWSTVRSRYWKNRSMDDDAAEYGDESVSRMARGLAPQRANDRAPGGTESLELSHEPIPYRAGGRGFVERWPCEHADYDPEGFRFPGYCQ